MNGWIILLAFASGLERDKFEEIYNSYKKLMLHKAYSILQDYMLAEDAVSEACIRIFKNLHKIEDPASNKTIAFVVTIVRNVALTMLSKEKKTAAEPVDETQADDFDLEQHILSEISSSEIFSLLDGLSEELRDVFVLKFAYDLPHKEIGRLLGISENNVTVRLHRAKKKLSAVLEKEGFVREA